MHTDLAPTRRSSTTAVALAVAAQATLIVYFLVQNYVSLAPWNNLTDAGSQLASTLVGLVPGIGVIVALLVGGRRARQVAAAWTWVWLGLQIAQWWVPYLFDVHPLTQDGGQWYVDGGYDQTVHLIPTEPGRVVPDAQHNVLQVLSLLAAILTTHAARTEHGDDGLIGASASTGSASMRPGAVDPPT